MGQSGSALQLTRAADYGVRVMIHLATLPERQRALLPALAKATAAPSSFLSKVLQALCRAGFIDSRRGQSGGFEILPPGRDASIRAIVECIEGPVCLNLCLASTASCQRKPHCPAHTIWNKAQEAVLNVLNSTTVAELASEACGQAQAAAAEAPTA